jgi:hypothetical protein
MSKLFPSLGLFIGFMICSVHAGQDPILDDKAPPKKAGGVQQQNKPQAAPAPKLDLEHTVIYLQNMPAESQARSGNGGSFYKGKEKVEFKLGTLDTTVNPPRLEVMFKANGKEQVLSGEVKQVPIDISSVRTAYPFVLRVDSKTSIIDYIDQLNNQERKFAECYTWETDAFGLDQLGIPDLDFEKPSLSLLNKNRMRVLKFKKAHLETESKKEASHKTYLKIYYGFDNDPQINPFVFHTIDHVPTPTSLPNIKFLDDQRRMKCVDSVLYNEVSQQLRPWAEAMNIERGQYVVPVPSNSDPEPLVVFAAPYHSQLTWPRPEGDMLNQYYEYASEFAENSCYMWTDGARNFFLTRKTDKSFYPLNQPVANQDKLTFTKKTNTGIRFETVEKTDIQLPYPHDGKFNIDGAFKRAYYKTNAVTYTAQGAVQTWVEEPASTDNIRVTITGVRNINGWIAPVKAWPTIIPTQTGNDVVLDLSSKLHQMKSDQYEQLRDYLTLAYWMELKSPVVKYHSKPISVKDTWVACEWLNKLMLDLVWLKFDFDEGTFLEYDDRVGTLYMRPLEEFQKRDVLGFSQWTRRSSPSSLLKRIESYPSLQVVDLTSCIFGGFSSFLSTLIESPKVQGVRYGKCKLSELETQKLSTNQIGLLLSKMIGVQDIELPKVDVGNYAMVQAVHRNSDTLTHVDLTGLKELSHLADYFTKGVAFLPKLVSLKLLHTDLTNEQTQSLATALEKKTSLEHLELRMPYTTHTGLEVVTLEAREAWKESGTLGGKAKLVGKAAISIPFTALSFAFFTQFNLVAPLIFGPDEATQRLVSYGISFRSTLFSLIHIKNLKSLTLEVREWIQNQQVLRDVFAHLRTKHEFTPVQIQFE